MGECRYHGQSVPVRWHTVSFIKTQSHGLPYHGLYSGGILVLYYIGIHKEGPSISN